VNTQLITNIAEYGDTYWVSPDGDVFKKLIPNLHHQGYLRMNLQVQRATRATRKRRYWLIHRLVAAIYLPNPYNLPEVHHKNAIKGDNKVSNLEWVTSRQNALYREEAKRAAAQDN